jgi:hypothetical protein
MGTRPLRAPVECGWHPLRCLRHYPAGAWHPGAVPLSLRLFSISSLALLPGSLVLACSYWSFVLPVFCPLPTLGPTFGPPLALAHWEQLLLTSTCANSTVFFYLLSSDQLLRTASGCCRLTGAWRDDWFAAGQCRVLLRVWGRVGHLFHPDGKFLHGARG